MQCNREDNPVCTFLWLCYFYKRFGSSFWGKEKGKVQKPATIQQLVMMQDSPLLWQEVLWSQSVHSHQSPHPLSRCPVTCLPRLFFKTLGDWAFSRVKWIWPFPNAPQLQPTHGVWAHLGSTAAPGPLWHACRLSPAQGGICLLLQLCSQEHVGNYPLPSPAGDSKSPAVHSTLSCTCRT